MFARRKPIAHVDIRAMMIGRNFYGGLRAVGLRSEHIADGDIVLSFRGRHDVRFDSREI
jgi:hypothetical protein